ncbi:hypothetical protein ASD30_25105 [Nocardioides sp. Root140]|nr:hypothetical protein ASD30_25105 [Nocardioides sp. Root140]
MGAWGIGPWHNDGAWDWLCHLDDVLDPLFDRLQAALASEATACEDCYRRCERTGFCRWKGDQIIAAAAILNALKTVLHHSGDMLAGESQELHELRHRAAEMVTAIRDDELDGEPHDEWERDRADMLTTLASELTGPVSAWDVAEEYRSIETDAA